MRIYQYHQFRKGITWKNLRLHLFQSKIFSSKCFLYFPVFGSTPTYCQYNLLLKPAPPMPPSPPPPLLRSVASHFRALLVNLTTTITTATTTVFQLCVGFNYFNEDFLCNHTLENISRVSTKNQKTSHFS